MINYTLMFVAKKDQPDIIEAFNDYQEKMGVIKKAGKKEWEATIFGKGIKKVLPSQEQARRFIEANY